MESKKNSFNSLKIWTKLLFVLLAIVLCTGLIPVQGFQAAGYAFADEPEQSDSSFTAQDEESSSSDESTLSDESSSPDETSQATASSDSQSGSVDVTKNFTSATGSSKSFTTNDDFVVVASYDQLVDTINKNPSSKISLLTDISMYYSGSFYIDHFEGVLEGNGHTISSVGVLSSTDSIAVFNKLNNGAKIHNVNFDLNIEARNASAIAKIANGNVEISDCTINGTYIGNAGTAGGEFDFDAFKGTHAAGAICFANEGANVTFSNVTVNAEVSCQGDDDLTRYAGGLIAVSDHATVNVDNCSVSSKASVDAVGAQSIAFRVTSEIFKLVIAAIIGGSIESWIDSTSWATRINLNNSAYVGYMMKVQLKAFRQGKAPEQLQTMFNRMKNYYKRQVGHNKNVVSEGEAAINEHIGHHFLSGNKDDLNLAASMTDEELDWFTLIAMKSQVAALKESSLNYTGDVEPEWQTNLYDIYLRSYVNKFNDLFKKCGSAMKQEIGEARFNSFVDDTPIPNYQDLDIYIASISKMGLAVREEDPALFSEWFNGLTKAARFLTDFSYPQAMSQTKALFYSDLVTHSGNWSKPLYFPTLGKQCSRMYVRELAETNKIGLLSLNDTDWQNILHLKWFSSGKEHTSFETSVIEDVSKWKLKNAENSWKVDSMEKVDFEDAIVNKINKILSLKYEDGTYFIDQPPCIEPAEYNFEKFLDVNELYYQAVWSAVDDLVYSKNPYDMEILAYLRENGGNNFSLVNHNFHKGKYLDYSVYLWEKAQRYFRASYFEKFGEKESVADMQKLSREICFWQDRMFSHNQRGEFYGRDFFGAYQNVLLNVGNLNRTRGVDVNGNIIIGKGGDPVKLLNDFELVFGEGHGPNAEYSNVEANDYREGSLPILTYLYNGIKHNDLDKSLAAMENEAKSVVASEGLVGNSSGKSSVAGTILSQLALSLGQSEGGVGTLHWNGYAGGFIGTSEGGSVSISNSSNQATVVAGHNAGGIIGCTTGTTLAFESVSNSGAVSTTDNAFYTAAGGFIGQAEDVTSMQFTFDKCFNASPVLSHRIAGGFIGMLDGGTATVNNSGSVSGIAAPSNASGFIGFIDEGNAKFLNCYSDSDYDVVSSRIVFIPLNYLFFSDVNITPYEDDRTKNNLAGAFVGNDKNQEFINCYYKAGTNPIGEDSNPNVGGTFEVQPYQIASGEVCWNLNYANREGSSDVVDYRADVPFGQVIDNFNLGSREVKPVPNSKNIVYKNEYEEVAYYTNFNPRTIEFRTATFDLENINISPDITHDSYKMRVKKGSDVEFALSSDEGYKIGEVFLERTLESGQTKTEKLIPVSSDDDYNKKFVITKLDEDVKVTAHALEFEASVPKGSGTQTDPYLISNRPELYWFNQTFAESGYGQIYVKLTNDIDYSGIEWKTLYSPYQGLGFSGVFDGDGHRIIIDSYTSTLPVGAFFGGVDGGTFKNLTISGNFPDAIFAYAARNATFENCCSQGNVNSSGVVCGGLVAVADSKNDFINCTNEATIKQETSENEAAAGGIVGKLTDKEYLGNGSNSTELVTTLKGCVNKGYIYAADPASDNYGGGIVGIVAAWDTTWSTTYTHNDFKTVDVQIIKCENYANIADGNNSSYNNLSAGGMLGAYYCCKASGKCHININACINWGNVGFNDKGGHSFTQAAGGFLGWANCYGVRLFVWNSINAGNVWAYGDDAGGFVGTVGGCNGNWSNGMFVNSASLGKVSSDDCAGSIIGSGYFYVSNQARVNGYSGGLLTSGWCDNVYVAKACNCGPIDDTTGVDIINWDCYDKNHFSEDYMSHHGKGDIDNEYVYTAKLAYEINEFYKNKLLDPSYKSYGGIPNYIEIYGDNAHASVFGEGSPLCVFGQNIDIPYNNGVECPVQSTPHLLADNCLQVFKSNNTVFSSEGAYTNYDVDSMIEDMESGENQYYNINIPDVVGQGNINGITKAKRGTNVTITLEPKAGWSIGLVVVDGENYDILNRNTIQFDNIESDHTIDYVEFIEASLPNREVVDGQTKFLISSIAELKWFANYVNEKGHSDAVATLTQDIFIPNKESLISIGTKEHPFSGKFDGANRVLTLDAPKPLFGYVDGGQITNLSISASATISDGSQVENNSCSFLINESNNANVSNINIAGTVVSKIKLDRIASFVNIANSGNNVFSNCVNSINYSGTADAVAGFIAEVNNGSVALNDCKNTGSINMKSEGAIAAGAIALINVGAENTNIGQVELNGFVNEGKVYAMSCASGILGKLEFLNKSNDNFKLVFDKCENKSEISSDGDSAGFVSFIKSMSSSARDITITNSMSKGNIVSTSTSGGLVALNLNSNIHFDINNVIVGSDTINSGPVSGGLLGQTVSLVNKANINNTAVFVKTLTGDKCGTYVGFFSNGNPDLNADNTFCYSNTCDRTVGNEGEYQYDTDEAYTNFLTGFVAYSINNNHDSNADLAVGQNIDLAGSVFQDYPAFSNIEVYEVEPGVYSNYKSKPEDFYTVAVHSTASSEETPVNYIYKVNKGANCEINLSNSNKEINVLSGLYVDGSEVDYRNLVKNNKYIIQAVDKNTDVLYSFNKEERPLVAEDGSYKITNANELLWFANFVNTQDETACAIIENDINLKNYEWVSIGNNEGKPFKGKIISNEKHTISNIMPNVFIRYMENGYVENLNLNVAYTDRNLGGCVMQMKNSEISGVSVTGKMSFSSEAIEKNRYVGGIVGQICDENLGSASSCSKVLNCVNDCVINSAAMSDKEVNHAAADNNVDVGGIVGLIKSKDGFKIDSCENLRNLSCDVRGNNAFVGGIVGRLNETNSILAGADEDIINCINRGKIYSEYTAGGVLSIYEQKNSKQTVNLTRNINYGNINGIFYAGGVLAMLEDCAPNSAIKIYTNINHGKVEAMYGSGGIVGELKDNDATLYVQNCGNTGDIVMTYQRGDYENPLDIGSGGIIGATDDDGHGVIGVANSYNAGKISVVDDGGYPENAGSIFGINFDGNDVNVWNFYDVEEQNNKWRGQGDIKLHESVNRVKRDVFKSGEITFKLSNFDAESFVIDSGHSMINERGQFAQIIDNYQNGDKQIFPTINIDDKNIVYEVQKGEDLVYSNFNVSASEEAFKSISISVVDKTDINAISSNFGNVNILKESGAVGSDCVGVNYISTGSDFACVVQANEGYIISKIFVNGVERKQSDFSVENPWNVIKFSNVTTDNEIYVEFSNNMPPSAGDGSVANPYQISNYNELLWLSKFVNSSPKTETNVNAILTSDIDCKGSEWVPIGSDKRPYNGVFDGNGYKIIGLTNISNQNSLAFVRNAENATIKNIEFEEINFASSSNASGVVSTMTNSTLENIRVISGKVISSKNMAGLVGEVRGSAGNTITNCHNDGVVFAVPTTDNFHIVGGVVRCLYGGAKLSITSCTNSSDISSNSSPDGYTGVNDTIKDDNAAGILGEVNHDTNLTLTSCVNYGRMVGNRAGGIVGAADYSSNGSFHASISQCVNYGQICGRVCGGIFGDVEDCDDGSKLNISYTINEGFVGAMGTILEDCGGIIGLANDNDCDIRISNTVNRAAVVNDESTSFFMTQWITGVSGAAGIVLPPTIWGALCALGVCAPGVGGAISAAVFSLLAVGTVIYEAIAGRMFVQQYAGGICGEFDAAFADVTLQNVVNLGYVQATNWSDGISPDTDSDMTIDNVFSLGGEGGDLEYVKHVKYLNLDSFSSGEIAYLLQSSSIEGSKVWGQVIDNPEAGTIQNFPVLATNESGLPDSSLDGVKVYKLNRNEGKPGAEEDIYYSNFDRVIEPNVPLFVRGEKEDGFVTNSIVREELSDYVDVTVLESNLTGDIQPNESNEEQLVNYYTANNAGYITVRLTPKEDKYSIKDIVASKVSKQDSEDPASNDDKVEWTYNDDGSIIQLINPVYEEKDNIKTLVSYDYSFTYGTDNSVLCRFGKAVSSEYKYYVDFTILDGPTKVYKTSEASNKSIMLWPYNKTNTLPDEAWNYYLNNNVVLDSDWIIPENDATLSLNGKTIKLSNGAQIIKNSPSEYTICDYEHNTSHRYTIENGRYVINESPSDATNNDVDNASKEGQIIGGIIYSDSSARSGDSAIELQNGKLNLDNISIVQSGFNSALDCTLPDSQGDKIPSLYFNSQVFGAPVGYIDTQNSSDDYCASINIAYEIPTRSKLVFGNKANFVRNDFVEEVFGNYADLFVVGQNAIVDFENYIGLSNPIRVKSLQNAILSKTLIAKADITKAFEAIDSDYCIAYTGKAGEIDDLRSPNNVCICKKEDAVDIKYTIQGNGVIYPYVNSESVDDKVTYTIPYLKGSDVKLTYNSEDLNSLVSLSYINPFTEGSNQESVVLRTLPDNGFYVFNDIQGPAEVTAKFESSINLALDALNGDGVVVWKDGSKLPEGEGAASQTREPKAYKLDTDIKLTDTWEVPEGKIALDLAGHSITFDKTAEGFDDDGFSNKNLIHINHEDTILTIVDSSQVSPNNATKHYFKYTEDFYLNNFGEFHEVAASEPHDFEVQGGVIYGADIKAWNYEYYSYNTTAGAVNVESGAFNFHSGTIAGNNVRFTKDDGSINGGAAISVNEDSFLNIYKGANVCYNSMSGDDAYLSQYFAGAVASKGKFYNEGNVFHNRANQYAASAVAVCDGSFENAGNIYDNHCVYNESRMSLKNFGTVYNAAYFFNAGFICENKSDEKIAAIENNGIIYIGSHEIELNGQKTEISSNVYDNSYTDKDTLVEDTLDINSGSVVNITGKLIVNKPSVVDWISTRGWYNADAYTKDIFKSSSEEYTVVVGEGSELTLAKEADAAQLDVNVVGEGKSLIKTDLYAFEQNINAYVDYDEETILTDINLDGESLEIDQSGDTANSFVIKKKVYGNDDVKLENHDLDIYFEGKEEHERLGEKQNWYSEKKLPTDCGEYVLQNDIVLDYQWIAPLGKITIDLNGYNITSSDKHNSLISVVGDDTNLTIKDSSYGRNDLDKKNYLRLIPGSDHIYDISREGGAIEVPTGIIGGSQEGAIYCIAGTLNLEGGTVAANNIKNNGTDPKHYLAAALNVYENAKVNIGEDASIACNSAENPDYVDFTSAASLGVYGNVVNKGWIVGNYATKNAVAGVYVEEDGHFVNEGIIQSNVAKENSASALRAYKASYVENSGSILNNKALADTSMNVVVRDCTLINTGKIHDNYSAAGDFAGVYVAGANSKLVYDGVGRIYNNGVSADFETIDEQIDLVFDDVESAPIILKETLDCSIAAQPSYVKLEDAPEYNFVLTRGFDLSIKDPAIAYNYFVSATDEYEIAYGTASLGVGELFYSKVGTNSYIKVSSNNGGRVSHNGESTLLKDTGVSLSVSAQAEAGNFIESVSVNGQQQEVPADATSFNLDVSDANDAAIVVNFKEVDSNANKVDTSSYKQWTSSNSLPQTSGSWILTSDIVLEQTCVPDKNSVIKLDLAGHIVSAKSNTEMRLLDLSNDGVELDIFDTSNNNITHRYNKSADGNYEFAQSTNSETVEIQGGALFGGRADAGAGVLIGKNSYLALNGANIIGCVAKYNGGAIMNYGKLLINEDSVVAGNVAQVGAGVYNDIDQNDKDKNGGKFVNAGSITDNTAIVTATIIENGTVKYVNEKSKAAGVFNNAMMSIKGKSNIVKNIVVDRFTGNKTNQDLVLANCTETHPVEIEVIGKLTSKEKCYVLCEFKQLFTEAQITKDWATYAADIPEGTYMAAGESAYSIKEGANGELFAIKL